MTIRSYLLPALAGLILVYCAGCKKNLTAEGSGQGTTTAPRSTVDGNNYRTETFDLPVRLDTPFFWGVNGHPLTQVAYFGNLPVQMSLLKELQASYYRADFNCDANGNVNSIYLGPLFSAAAVSGINILPILIFPSGVFQLPVSAAEAAGKTMALGFMQNYGTNFPLHYYELGNEVDLKCLPGSPTTDGDNPAIYFTDSVAIAFNYLKGMIEGVKQADPQAKTIINSANHYAFFTVLNNYAASNGVAPLPFDIIGFHTYSGTGTGQYGLPNTLAQLNTFNKDIWFTELNDNTTLTDTTAQGDTIMNYVQAMDEQPRVRGFLPYELFDEDYFSGNEGIYGLTYWSVPFNFSSAVGRKPVYESYKFKIEEAKNGWYDFAYSTFLYCDFRAPDPGGLAFWTNWLISNRNIPLAFNIILPQENYSRWVNQQFELFLGREADSIGLAAYTQQLVNGATRESIIETICGGTEFAALAGGTSGGVVIRLFTKLLNRLPNSSEATSYVNFLNGGHPAWQAAQDILQGQEYLTDFVTASFNWYLRRNGDIAPTDIQFAVQEMENGMTQLDYVKTLLNSYEFYARAIKEGYVRNNPGESF